MEIDKDSDVGSDRNMLDGESLTENTWNIRRAYILNMMPNWRYSRLVEYCYINEKSKEETAMLLAVITASYYNMYKRVKA